MECWIVSIYSCDYDDVYIKHLKAFNDHDMALKFRNEMIDHYSSLGVHSSVIKKFLGEKLSKQWLDDFEKLELRNLLSKLEEKSGLQGLYLNEWGINIEISEKSIELVLK